MKSNGPSAADSTPQPGGVYETLIKLPHINT